MTDETPESEKNEELPATAIDGWSEGETPLSTDDGTEMEHEPIQERFSIQYQNGDVFAKRFEVIQNVGSGGMGLVYKVKDLLMDGEIKALKVILPSLVKSTKAQERFVREARIAQKLAHPNIVNTYDLGEHEGIRFITMEFLEGQSLAERLTEKGPMSLKETLRTIRPVLLALEFAHESTVHRDIKPQNIFHCTDGKIKVLDFGLARMMGAEAFTQSNVIAGTPAYMAPEQLDGKEASAESDLYAVGVVMYQCLSGKLPTGRFKLPGEQKFDSPPHIDQLLDELLSPSPDDRPADCHEILERINSPAIDKPDKQKKLVDTLLEPLELLEPMQKIKSERDREREEIARKKSEEESDKTRQANAKSTGTTSYDRRLFAKKKPPLKEVALRQFVLLITVILLMLIVTYLAM